MATKATVKISAKELVATTVKEINKYMTDKKWVSKNRLGPTVGLFYWRVEIPTHLGGVNIPMLDAALKKDGWQKVLYGSSPVTHIHLFQSPQGELRYQPEGTAHA